MFCFALCLLLCIETNIEPKTRQLFLDGTTEKPENNDNNKEVDFFEQCHNDNNKDSFTNDNNNIQSNIEKVSYTFSFQ